MEQHTDMDQLAINTIRMLAIDAVQKAKSGHPGTPMDAAPTAYALWQRFLRYDPVNPDWINRDRFVLSAGHASMLLYSLIYLARVKAVHPSYEQPGRDAVTLQDIETFRQAGSRCPGHPEFGWTSGVETTTGPLGQGAATSVGMAAAERFLAATYNRPGFDLFDFNVYALCGDGDMMEGISSEAASLAGHLRLANLCWIYDSNRVTIEGHTDIAFTEDVAARFLAYGWNVTRVSDPNDPAQLDRAYRTFIETTDRPTFIVVHSHIGYGSPHKHDSPEAHGEPLGEAEVRLTKQFFGFDPDQSFVVPDGVREHFTALMGARGATLRAAWDSLFARYRAEHPDLAGQIDHIIRHDLPDGWDSAIPVFPPSATGLSTRDASGQVLNAVAAHVPWLIGGAADLSPSTKTHLNFAGAGDFQPPGTPGSYAGRNLHFGVREHAMCAAVNGLTLTGAARVRLGLPDLHRLRPRRHPAGVPDGPAGDPYLDARFDRCRRGWPHTPADRADRVAAGDPRNGGDPPGRRQRNGRGVSDCHAVPAPSRRADLLAPAVADRRSCGVRVRQRTGPRGLRAGRCAERTSRGDPDRDRQ